jgi:hypothetical protein
VNGRQQHKWRQIAKLNNGSAWKYTWTVPAVGAKKDECLFKVVLQDNNGASLGYYISDMTFTITP